MSVYFKRARVVCGRATVAQVNAGLTIVDAEAGRTNRVVWFHLRAIGGAASAVTTVDLKDTAGTPITIATVAQTNLTENTLLIPTSTGVTLGAGWNADLTAEKGIQLTKTGSAVGTATHIEYCVVYVRA